MKKLLNKEWVVYLVYVILALVGIWFLTKLWIPEGYAIAGHDSGLAVNAWEFFKSRLFAWSPQGFGRDNSGYFGSLTIHFIDFASSKIANVIYSGNQINVFFWISAIFLSAAIFAGTLKNKFGKYFKYLFPVFITFNFYILQSIFIVERAKYSLLIGTLLFLTIFLQARDKKMPLIASGVLISIVFSFFNGGSWLGLPLYGGLLVVLLSALLFEIVMLLKEKRWSNLIRLLTMYVIIGIGFLILNAYSIYPYVSKFLKQDYNAVTNQKVVSANKGWLDNLSQASSYLNIFRLQGVPDWYAGETKINTVHSYANYYTSNYLLIISSFIFPVLIIVSFLLIKIKEQKILIVLFGIILFLGMFFMAGSHPPLGYIYTIFYKYIPGFSIFRSPYYKFGSAFFIAASFLIAFSLSRLIEQLSGIFKNKYNYWVGVFLSIAAVVLWLGFYNIIFRSDKIFTWQSGLTTQIKIPSYVADFAKWFDNEPTGESRTLLLPPVNSSWKNDAYNWGYWSLTNLPSVVSDKPFVVNSELEIGQEVWINKLYSLFAEGDELGVYDYSNKLGIDYILFRDDVLSDSSWSSVTSPTIYRDRLNSFTTLSKTATFGPWTIYKFKRDLSPLFYAANNIVSINTNYPYISQTFYSDRDSIYNGDKDLLNNNLSEVVNSYSCESCPLEEKEALTSLPAVSVLPNSPLYVLKQRNEERIIGGSLSRRSKIDAYLGFALRRGAEAKFMWDMRLDTNYALTTLTKINNYLKELHNIFDTQLEDDQQYFEAKRVMDNLNIVEQSFREIVSSHDFGGKDQNYRQGVLDVLWNIGELKRIFPIIDDRKKLETEKIYLVQPSGTNKRNIYLDENTLPLDLEGHPILPHKVTFVSDGKSVDVKLTKTKLTLIKLNLPDSYGSGKIILKFPEFPNLFVKTGLGIEKSPSSYRSCIEGTLSQFNVNKKYRVEVIAAKPWQVLKLFLKDGEIKNGDSQFIQGQDEAEISPTLSLQPFYHIYQPSSGSSGLKIYLCNSNETPPEVERFEFHEIASPDILSIDELPDVSDDKPQINFKKIDAAHYQVNIGGAKAPFILIFNQSYNPNWNISGSLSPHFMVNGYANAWKISETGSYSLDLTYVPQVKFRKGLIISLSGLVGLLAILFLTILNRKRSNENK